MTDFNFDIWRLQAQGDVPGLMQLLKHANPDLRRRAATALRALGASMAIPALQSALMSEGDKETRVILLSAMDYLFELASDEKDKETLRRQHRVVHWIAQLSSDYPEQIVQAARDLGNAKEKIAVEALVIVFRNGQHPARVRLAAAEALLKLESAPVEVTLLAALRHSDWHIRRNAAGVLGQLHADWAVEPLIAALRDAQEIVRRTAHAALKRIGTPEALKAVDAALTTSELKMVVEHTQPQPPPVTLKPPEIAAPVVEVKPPIDTAQIQTDAPITPKPPEVTAPALAVIAEANISSEKPPEAAVEQTSPAAELVKPPEVPVVTMAIVRPPTDTPLLPLIPAPVEDDTQPSTPVSNEDVG